MASLFQVIEKKIKKKYRKLRVKFQKPLAISPDEKRTKVHLGCGKDRLAGFVNIDCQPTPATDRVLDLAFPDFEPSSIALAFSHAFFEHMFRSARVPHLRQVCKGLVADGACCYIGIPYFPNIAKLYVEGGNGSAGPKFDLANVYGYTHGSPEISGDPVKDPALWIGQLHKSLFDEEEMTGLLEEAGFGSQAIFSYANPGDTNEVPICMGFYAIKYVAPVEELRARALGFLQQFADRRIRMSTLQWL